MIDVVEIMLDYERSIVFVAVGYVNFNSGILSHTNEVIYTETCSVMSGCSSSTAVPSEVVSSIACSLFLFICVPYVPRLFHRFWLKDNNYYFLLRSHSKQTRLVENTPKDKHAEPQLGLRPQQPLPKSNRQITSSVPKILANATDAVNDHTIRKKGSFEFSYFSFLSCEGVDFCASVS